jgi:thiamine biosynthesis protein ThiI
VRPEEQVVLVSSAEFVLKSSHVRKSLEQRLIDDLRFALRKSGFQNFRIEKAESRIVVEEISDAPLAARVISRVFGVAYAVPAARIDESMETVVDAVRYRAAEALTIGQSFAIRCHHSARSALSTRDVEKEAGSQILEALADKRIHVNLDQPDVLISVDLSGNNAYLYTTRIPGPGGLPGGRRSGQPGPLHHP